MHSDQNIQNFINLCKTYVSEQNWLILEDFYKKSIETNSYKEKTYNIIKNDAENIIKDIFIRMKYNPILIKLQVESIDPKIDKFIILNRKEKEKLNFFFVLKIISSFPDSRYKLTETKNFINPIFSYKNFDVLNLYNKIIKEFENNNYFIQNTNKILDLDKNINEDFILNINGSSLEQNGYKLKIENKNIEERSKISETKLELTIELDGKNNLIPQDEKDEELEFQKLQETLFQEFKNENQKEKQELYALEPLEHSETDTSNTEEQNSSNKPEGFIEIARVEIKPDKFLIISKTDSGFWINEYIKKENYTGNTNHGFGINVSDYEKFIELVEDTLKTSKENRIKWMGSSTSELVITKNPSSAHKDKNYVDLRKFIHTSKYTGYTKKGIRLFEDEFLIFFKKFRDLIKV
jgi:hypothetical protein